MYSIGIFPNRSPATRRGIIHRGLFIASSPSELTLGFKKANKIPNVCGFVLVDEGEHAC